MLEYVLVVSDRKLHDADVDRLWQAYTERSILNESDSHLKLKILDGCGLFLARHRFDHQGHPVHLEGANLTALVGWIVDDDLPLSSTTIVERLSTKVRAPNAQNWLDGCLGEFQIVSINSTGATFFCSEMMTHPLYYRVTKEGTCVSNRATLTRVSDPHNAAIDIQGQLEVIAFASMLDDRTSFVDTKCVQRGHTLSLDVRNPRTPTITRHARCIAEPEQSDLHGDLTAAVQAGGNFGEWLVGRMQLFSKQYRMEPIDFINLSGGKDSRLLLCALWRSGLADYHDAVLTMGQPDDPEVLAASKVAQYFGLDHVQRPRVATDPVDLYFGRLADHIFQVEGEVGSQMLHGNFRAKRPIHFTGHEAGLRETNARPKDLVSAEDVDEYIEYTLPIDVYRWVQAEAREEMRRHMKSLARSAAGWGVVPRNFPIWYSVVGRGTRWVGKLTSMSSPSGPYINIFCSTPIVRFAHRLGPDHRKNEIFHFSLMAALEPELLQYAFAHQTWPDVVNDRYRTTYRLADFKYERATPAAKPTYFWDLLYHRNERRNLARLIEASRHPALDGFVDYARVYRYLEQTPAPHGRYVCALLGIVSSNLLLHAGDITEDARKQTEDISRSLREEYENADRLTLPVTRLVRVDKEGIAGVDERKGRLISELRGLIPEAVKKQPIVRRTVHFLRRSARRISRFARAPWPKSRAQS